MDVFLKQPITPSKALARVHEALLRYKFSGVNVTAETLNPRLEYDADLVVIPVVGRFEQILALAEKIKTRGQQYALIQYAFKSTQKPHTSTWIALWANAKVVWSYYDLPQLALEDGRTRRFNFYHAPLGVDDEVFKPSGEVGSQCTFAITTSGRSRLTESVREAEIATRLCKRKMFHLGALLALGDHVTCGRDLDDATLARIYTDSDFVSGLRRIEGFELPAAEGLLCGTRPILFDRPHYRKWYDGLGVFIPETDRQGVVDALISLIDKGPRYVTETERAEAVFRFSWDRILKGFWEACANKA